MLPILFEFGSVKIYSFGVFLFLALFVGLYWWWKMGRDEHYEEIELFDGYFLTLTMFFVTARVAYVWMHPEIQTWYRAFALLAYPGFYVEVGFFLATLYLVWFARMRQWEVWKILDMTSVASAVILAVSAIGALLNGSNPGVESAWGLVYAGETVRRMPVDLWTLIWSILTFGIVSRVRKQFRFFAWYKGEASVARDGLTFLVFWVMAGIYFLVTGLVDDIGWKIGPVPVVMLFGLGLSLAGGIWIYLRSGKNRGSDLLQWVGHIGKRRS